MDNEFVQEGTGLIPGSGTPLAAATIPAVQPEEETSLEPVKHQGYTKQMRVQDTANINVGQYDNLYINNLPNPGFDRKEREQDSYLNLYYPNMKDKIAEAKAIGHSSQAISAYLTEQETLSVFVDGVSQAEMDSLLGRTPESKRKIKEQSNNNEISLYYDMYKGVKTKAEIAELMDVSAYTGTAPHVLIAYPEIYKIKKQEAGLKATAWNHFQMAGIRLWSGLYIGGVSAKGRKLSSIRGEATALEAEMAVNPSEDKTQRYERLMAEAREMFNKMNNDITWHDTYISENWNYRVPDNVIGATLLSILESGGFTIKSAVVSGAGLYLSSVLGAAGGGAVGGLIAGPGGAMVGAQLGGKAGGAAGITGAQFFNINTEANMEAGGIFIDKIREQHALNGSVTYEDIDRFVVETKEAVDGIKSKNVALLTFTETALNVATFGSGAIIKPLAKRFAAAATVKEFAESATKKAIQKYAMLSPIKQYAVRQAVGGASNAFEEGAQSIIQDIEMGRDVDWVNVWHSAGMGAASSILYMGIGRAAVYATNRAAAAGKTPPIDSAEISSVANGMADGSIQGTDVIRDGEVYFIDRVKMDDALSKIDKGAAADIIVQYDFAEQTAENIDADGEAAFTEYVMTQNEYETLVKEHPEIAQAIKDDARFGAKGVTANEIIRDGISYLQSKSKDHLYSGTDVANEALSASVKFRDKLTAGLQMNTDQAALASDFYGNLMLAGSEMYGVPVASMDRIEQVNAITGDQPFNASITYNSNSTAGVILNVASNNLDAAAIYHELWHLGLDNLIKFGSLESANTETKADRANVINWLGISDLNFTTGEFLLNKESSDYKRYESALEKWAESGENYLSKGIAPTHELQSLFDKIKDYFIRSIASLTGRGNYGDVTIPPAIEEVYAKMIAIPMHDTSLNNLNIESLDMMSGSLNNVIETEKVIDSEAASISTPAADLAPAEQQVAAAQAEEPKLPVSEMTTEEVINEIAGESAPEGIGLYQVGYNGSPNKFVKFDLKYIGSGEGAQAFGWGFYFAQIRDVAEEYRTALAAAGDTGQLYEVKIPPMDKLMAYDAVIKDQPESVSVALRALADKVKDLAAEEKYITQANLTRERNKAAIERIRDTEKIWFAAADEIGSPSPGKGMVMTINEYLNYLDGVMDENKENNRSDLYIRAYYAKSILNQMIDNGAVPGDFAGQKPSPVLSDRLAAGKAGAPAGSIGALESRAMAEAAQSLAARFKATPIASVIEFSEYLKKIDSIVSGIEQRGLTGGGLYRALSDILGSDIDASIALNEVGIPGLAYLDANSRGDAAEKSYNFVVWDDNVIDIAQTFYQKNNDSNMADRIVKAKEEAKEAKLTLRAVRQQSAERSNAQKQRIADLKDKLKTYRAEKAALKEEVKTTKRKGKTSLSDLAKKKDEIIKQTELRLNQEITKRKALKAEAKRERALGRKAKKEATEQLEKIKADHANVINNLKKVDRVRLHARKLVEAINREANSKSVYVEDLITIKDYLDGLKLKKLSLNELEFVHETVTAIAKEGRETLRSIQEQRKLRRDDNKLTVIDLMKRKLSGEETQEIVTRRDHIDKQYRGLTGQIGKGSDLAGAELLSIPRMAKWLDGGKDNIFTKLFFDDINLATNEELRNRDRRIEGLSAHMESIGITTADLVEKVGVKDVPTANPGGSWTLNEMGAVYALNKNEMGRAALLYGAFSRHPNPELALDAVLDALNDHANGQKVKSMAEYMFTDSDNNFDRINEVLIREFNVSMTREENYFPLSRVRGAQENQKRGLLGAATFTGEGKRVDLGFTKARQKLSEYRQGDLVLDLYGGFLNQVQVQEHTTAYARVSGDVNALLSARPTKDEINSGRLTKWDTVKNVISKRYGASAYDSLKGYAEIFSTDDVSIAHTLLDSVSQKLIRNAGYAYICWNMGSAIMQGTGLPRFLGHTNLTSILAATADFMTRSDSFLQEVYEMDPQVKNRASGIELKIMKSEALYGATKYQRLLDRGFELMGYMDKVVAAIGYKAVYDTNMKAGNSKAESMKRAQKAVLLTQQATMSKDAPMIWHKNSVARLAMMFTREQSGLFGMLAYDFPNAIRNKEHRMAFGIAIGYAMTAAMAHMLKNGPPDDDEDESWAQWTSLALMEQTITSLPVIGKEIFSAMEHTYAPNNMSLARPFVLIGKGVGNTIVNAKEDIPIEEWGTRDILNVMEGLSLIFGKFPVSAIRRVKNAYLLMSEGEFINAMLSIIGNARAQKALETL